MRVPRPTPPLLAGVMAAVALAACGGAPDRPASPDRPSDTTSPPSTGEARSGDPAPTPSCDGLERAILAAEATPDALARAFGPPRRRSVETAPNRHVPGAVDSLVALSWEGLEIRFRDPPGKGPLAQRVVVRDPRFVGHPELAPGTPATVVVEALGEPGRRTPEALVYDCGRGASQPVTFHLREGRVERIEISFYVD